MIAIEIARPGEPEVLTPVARPIPEPATGEVLARFERKGLQPVAIKLMTVEEDLANRHYAEHTDKPFFGELISFITRAPLVAMVLEGNEAIAAITSPASRSAEARDSTTTSAPATAASSSSRPCGL